MVDVVVRNSKHSFAETVALLEGAIVASGNRVFATIDQSAAARDAGLALRPTTLIVFGNPKGGTLLMDADPLIGLDLPLKLMIWEDDGVHVAYVPAKVLAERYEASGHDAVFTGIERALEAIVASVA
jgi:uncharacterized protein (DUF302 family)